MSVEWRNAYPFIPGIFVSTFIKKKLYNTLVHAVNIREFKIDDSVSLTTGF